VRRYPRADRAIADELRDTREKAGLSARQLATRVKKPHNYIARFESLAMLPTGGQLIIICRALGVRPAKFFAGVERRLTGWRARA